jgi:NAD(P)-dependent dehydrogenase (short-subunit alcohol dehydrogenase family)
VEGDQRDARPGDRQLGPRDISEALVGDRGGDRRDASTLGTRAESHKQARLPAERIAPWDGSTERSRCQGYPGEIADAAVYLASDESAFMTGSAFVIDGGMTAR